MNDSTQAHGSESHRFFPIGDGVAMKMLREHENGGRTFLISMRDGAVAPMHEHPGGEETYVLTGSLRIRNRVSHAREPVPDVVLRVGDYVFAPPGETHDGVAEGETSFLVVAPGGVVRTPRG
jgi:quercetin dioxygenase-like cupin family protein